MVGVRFCQNQRKPLAIMEKPSETTERRTPDVKGRTRSTTGTSSVTGWSTTQGNVRRSTDMMSSMMSCSHRSMIRWDESGFVYDIRPAGTTRTEFVPASNQTTPITKSIVLYKVFRIGTQWHRCVTSSSDG